MEHPIVLSGEMVEKIIEGEKTQIRKPVKPQPDHFHDYCDGIGWRPQIGDKEIKCPYGKVGDELWVREALRVGHKLEFLEGNLAKELIKENEWQFFTSTYQNNQVAGKWTVELVGKWTARYMAYPTAVPYEKGAKEGWCGTALWQWTKPYLPAIAMPRWAARIILKITEISVQELQKITENECRLEGYESDEWLTWYEDAQNIGLPEGSHIENLKEHTAYVWNTTHRQEYSWESNPWVWVIQFERV